MITVAYALRGKVSDDLNKIGDLIRGETPYVPRNMQSY